MIYWVQGRREKMLLKTIAQIGKAVAENSTGKASFWGIFEPKMPQKLNKKSCCNKKK